MVLGHLKAGVTPAQAIADLNSIGDVSGKDLSRKTMRNMTFTLARPGLAGDLLGGPLRAFLDGIDDAGGIDSAGRVRQPGQLVCGAGGGPFEGNCAAAGAGLEPADEFCGNCSPKRR